MNNIIHPIGDQSTDIASINNETANYLRELNHHFGLFVYRPGTFGSAQATRYHMVTAAGAPVGVAYTRMTTSKNGSDVVEYVMHSSFIHKERARGGTKSIRSSTCLKRLIKLLRLDLSQVLPTPRYVRAMHERIENQVQRASKLDTRDSTYISNDSAKAVLLNLFENKPIEPEIKDRLHKMFEKSKEAEKNAAFLKNEIAAFDKCYVLYGTADSPMMFGVAELVNKCYSFQDGVKCYKDLEELPQDFLLAYKMWKVGTNQNGLEPNMLYHTPLHEELLRVDSYNEAFAVFTSYDNVDSILGTEYTIAIPIPNAN